MDLAIEHGVILASILFVLGIIGVMVRRNVLFMLMSVEIMLNATGLLFILGTARWGKPDGQVMFIFILTMAAAEVAVGLALILRFYKQFKTLDTDQANKMKG